MAGQFFEVDAKTLRSPELLAEFIKRKEVEMSGDRPAREMAPMERILKDAALLRDAHHNVIQRLRVIRENMVGPIQENPTETAKTEGSGSFGLLQDRLSDMDKLLNDSMYEIERIEKAMGIMDAPPLPPPKIQDRR